MVERVDGGLIMNIRSRREESRRSGGGPSEGPLYVATALIAVSAVGLACLALSGVHMGSRPTIISIPDSTPISAATPTTASNSEAGTLAVGFLGGESTSWWATSVEVGLVPGISTGLRIGSGDLTIAEVRSQAEGAATPEGQPVVIQVGTEDIVEGASAVQIDQSMRSLWQMIIDRGGRPIAALLPPSNTFPGSVVAVNSQIRASAAEEGIAVLDVITPVSAVDGTWVAGLSDDGRQPNALGSAAMAAAVSDQLPALLGLASNAG